MMKQYVTPDAWLVNPDDTDILTTSLITEGDGDGDSYVLQL